MNEPKNQEEYDSERTKIYQDIIDRKKKLLLKMDSQN